MLTDERLFVLAAEKDDAFEAAGRAFRDGDSRKPEDVVEELVMSGGTPSALETICLFRSAARSRKVDGMHVLVHHAADHKSAFRALATRFLKDAGELAIPAYIHARKEPSPETRHWAWNVLDDAKRRLPGDAVQTKDYTVLAEILKAFADLRDQDAVPVIAAFVNSDRTVVRVAARQSLLDYGQGALWKLRETYSNLLGTQAVETWKAEEVAEHLYKALDKIRLEDVYVLIDEGLEFGKKDDLDHAIERFDQALAREPLLDRRGETTRFYYAKAKSVRELDRKLARSLLEKARWIGPLPEDAKKIDSELALLDGLDSVERGTPNASRFEEALVLDPTNDRAKKELAGLKKMVETPASRTRRYGIAGALLVAALSLIAFFGGKTKTPKNV